MAFWDFIFNRNNSTVETKPQPKIVGRWRFAPNGIDKIPVDQQPDENNS